MRVEKTDQYHSVAASGVCFLRQARACIPRFFGSNRFFGAVSASPVADGSQLDRAIQLDTKSHFSSSVHTGGPRYFVDYRHCLNWVLVRRRSDRLTAAIALIINKRPITDDLSIGSPIKIAELISPIAGTESKLNDVVIAGKLRATVTNAQNGNAVINGPL